MKRIGDFLAGLRSLGCFGLIFLLMAGMVAFGMAASMSLFGAFYSNWEYLNTLEMLEDTAAYHLNEMELSEQGVLFMMAYVDPEQADLETVTEPADELQTTFDELVETLSDADMYDDEQRGLVKNLQDGLAAHRQTFDQLVTYLQNGEEDAAAELTPQALEETDQMDKDLALLSTQVEQARMSALQTFPEDVQEAVVVITVGLIVLLLSGLVGYRVIQGLTQPLLVLTNAMTAIEGDRYHPDMLAELIKRGNLAGRFARTLDHLGRSLQADEAVLKQEVNDLRQQLYESRRKRLKISRPEA